MNLEEKRLYRSKENKVLAGVCGGLGEYLDVDPVLVRVAWVAMSLIQGYGILLYLAWIFVVPLKPYVEGTVRDQRKGGMAGILFGSAMIFLGFVFLAEEWHWVDLHWWGAWSWDYVFPVLLMGIGAWFLLRSRDQRESEGTAESSAKSKRKDSASTTRRFARESSGKKVFGVCAGIGTYLGVDTTIVRLLFVVVTLMNPPIGVLAYLALAIFTPVEHTLGNRNPGSQVS